MKATVVVLVAGLAFVGVCGTVTAETGQAMPPTGPENGTTTTANNSSDASPGQQLAGAVGAQGATVEGELWNRTLSDRLANATTPADRAEVVAEEVETLEAYLDALESVRENLTEAWTDGELSEGEYRTSLSVFVVRARTVEQRANQTAKAAADLPSRLRERADVNVTRARDLATRARELYQFEGEIGRQVVNETLPGQSSRSRIPAAKRDSA